MLLAFFVGDKDAATQYLQRVTSGAIVYSIPWFRMHLTETQAKYYNLILLQDITVFRWCNQSMPI
jgi:hypothetical protein